MANWIWRAMSTEQLTEELDYEDDDTRTLWEALVSRCYTIAVANSDRRIPLLQDPPADQHIARGDR